MLCVIFLIIIIYARFLFFSIIHMRRVVFDRFPPIKFVEILNIIIACLVLILQALDYPGRVFKLLVAASHLRILVSVWTATPILLSLLLIHYK